MRSLGIHLLCFIFLEKKRKIIYGSQTCFERSLVIKTQFTPRMSQNLLFYVDHGAHVTAVIGGCI